MSHKRTSAPSYPLLGRRGRKEKRIIRCHPFRPYGKAQVTITSFRQEKVRGGELLISQGDWPQEREGRKGKDFIYAARPVLVGQVVTLVSFLGTGRHFVHLKGIAVAVLQGI